MHSLQRSFTDLVPLPLMSFKVHRAAKSHRYYLVIGSAIGRTRIGHFSFCRRERMLCMPCPLHMSRGCSTRSNHTHATGNGTLRGMSVQSSLVDIMPSTLRISISLWPSISSIRGFTPNSAPVQCCILLSHREWLGKEGPKLVLLWRPSLTILKSRHHPSAEKIRLPRDTACGQGSGRPIMFSSVTQKNEIASPCLPVDWASSNRGRYRYPATVAISDLSPPSSVQVHPLPC